MFAAIDLTSGKRSISLFVVTFFLIAKLRIYHAQDCSRRNIVCKIPSHVSWKHSGTENILVIFALSSCSLRQCVCITHDSWCISTRVTSCISACAQTRVNTATVHTRTIWIMRRTITRPNRTTWFVFFRSRRDLRIARTF